MPRYTKANENKLDRMETDEFVGSTYFMKTTRRHLEAFKKECGKWIKVFGMLGWRFYYQHKDIEGRQIAYCCFPDKPEDRVFTIGLTLHLEGNYSMADIRRSAFHEVMEAFLYKIRFLAGCRYIQPEEIDEEVHHIIRTLENAVFEKS